MAQPENASSRLRRALALAECMRFVSCPQCYSVTPVADFLAPGGFLVERLAVDEDAYSQTEPACPGSFLTADLDAESLVDVRGPTHVRLVDVFLENYATGYTVHQGFAQVFGSLRWNANVPRPPNPGEHPIIRLLPLTRYLPLAALLASGALEADSVCPATGDSLAMATVRHWGWTWTLFLQQQPVFDWYRTNFAGETVFDLARSLPPAEKNWFDAFEAGAPGLYRSLVESHRDLLSRALPRHFPSDLVSLAASYVSLALSSASGTRIPRAPGGAAPRNVAVSRDPWL